MKSRFLLPSNLTLNRDSSSGDGVLSRPTRARATVSVARRFELRHNTSPKWARRRQERRQGQALLLAVLIMLLAALLSAGFLGVVSGNLNQSARIADKTRAIEASRSGIAYANAQLSGSSQGDLWRPDDVSLVPEPTAANYNFYYSQLDKVQGWANTLARPADTDTAANIYRFRNVTYGKFPAPEQSLGDAPKFLLRVEDLPIDPTDAYYASSGTVYDPDHAGEIKITSIGLSDDDPNVYHKTVAYKSGRRDSPFASALRSVSNWNFGDGGKSSGVPFGRVENTVNPSVNASVTIETKIEDQNVPQFSPDDVPFNVVIIRKDGTPDVRGAVVTAVTAPVAPATRATLTLAKLDRTVVPGETIQKAAAIGTGSTIDLLNTGQSPAPTFPAPPAGQSNQPNGILANGSVWLQNQVVLSDLSRTGTKLYASGSLAIDDNGANAKKLIISTSPESQIGPANSGDPDSNKVVPSSRPNFPGNIVLTTAAASNGVKPTDLINDGWNKINTQRLGLDYSGDTRDVRPFEPAKIDSAENLARYRALTRNSADGIYINNREDVEKVGTTAMTQKQLIDMLTAPTSTPAANYGRNDAALPTGSLEQRHLRGWVGPDEFLARGTLVEFIQSNGIPRIRLTHDARSDANPRGPELTKTVRDASGNFQAGVYSQILDWPKNGMLFAEGNIRMRGDINLSNLPTGLNPNDFPSLTVVSLNNIYIEGTLSVDSKDTAGNIIPIANRKKLMLLAKKNVIVNPTRAVIARTDVQTVADNAAPVTVTTPLNTPTTFDLPVKNAFAFLKGDYITVEATPQAIRGIVANDITSDTLLSIRTTNSGIITSGANVRSPLETRKEDDPTNVKATYSLVDTENAVNRRILVPVAQRASGAITNIDNKLVFDHVAELKETTPGRIDGIEIKAEDVPPTTTFVAELTNKQPLDGSTQDNNTREKSITSTNKKLRTYNNFPTMTGATSNQKDFTFAANKTIAQLITEISAHTETTGGSAPVIYRYTATPNGAIGALPSYALAGVGLRYAPEATVFTTPPPSPAPVGSANNSRENFSTANGFTIPLATSVEFNLNGVLADFQTLGESRAIRYVGFNPVFGTSDDGLTVDRYFYQPIAGISTKSTLDMRTLTLPISGAPTGFTNFPNSIVMKRTNAYSDATISDLLPAYRVKAMKVESYASNSNDIKPTGGTMSINAFVYAQEGSWFVIAGDYFRSGSPVRADVDTSGNFTGSYIDYANPGVPDPNEYIVEGGGRKVADLNRNGIVDTGEYEAAIHLTRYNTVKIEFLGAIVENQTAVVADVENPTVGQPPILKGAVQDWTDKWASYNDNRVAPILPPPGSSPGVTGAKNNFSFITYAYDDAIQAGRLGANQLRVPVTDELLYQQ